MSSRNDSEFEPPQKRRRLRKRVDEICSQLDHIEFEAPSEEDLAMNFRHKGGSIVDPPSEQEVNRRLLEASEQQAAAERKEKWERLQTELEDINRTGRARSSFETRRLGGNKGRVRDRCVRDVLRQSPQTQKNGSDALSSGQMTSVPPIENSFQSTGPRNDHGSDADDELDESDESGEVNSSDEDDRAGVGYISKKELDEGRLWGKGIFLTLYKSEATDALYFLGYLGEKIWLTDENGDCVLGQDQNLDQTTQ